MDNFIFYTVSFWLVGFIGGIGVLLYDYQNYGRDVLFPEFICDVVMTFLVWPTISHHIIIYALRALCRIFGTELPNLKNIVIVKGTKNE